MEKKKIFIGKNHTERPVTARESGTESKQEKCPHARQCGGCDYQGMAYEEQLKQKQKLMKKLLGSFHTVAPIIGMENPLHYRNKVHHVLKYERKKGLLCGFYEKGSHWVIDVDHCMLEDEKSCEIIASVRKLITSFRIPVFDEDTGTGFLRHILVRRGFRTNEILVVLVAASHVFPSGKNFVRALVELHPEITTVVLNVNAKKTSAVLGKQNITLYGNGVIHDTIGGSVFRLSPLSFFQVNSVQTEILYETAIAAADLTGNETVVDAYCGIGTIGILAARKAGQVIGIELNEDAISDAKRNAAENGLANITFYQGDAGDHLLKMAADGAKVDVIIMDPPRTGCTEAFLHACSEIAPTKMVYVSCGPESLKRDLSYLVQHGYKVKRIQPVDMFPYTQHVETVVLLSRT